MMRRFTPLAYDDDEILDRLAMKLPEPPEYPSGLQFRLSMDDLGKICDGECAPGMMLQFAAMGEATSVYRDMDDCRIEVELSQMAGPDGHFVDMDMPPSISLTGAELGKLDLDDDCERGDTIHIIGHARVESMSSSEFSEGITLQIVEAEIEDESEEGRDDG